MHLIMTLLLGLFQDIGLDGLNDSDEFSFYSEFTQSFLIFWSKFNCLQ